MAWAVLPRGTRARDNKRRKKNEMLFFWDYSDLLARVSSVLIFLVELFSRHQVLV